MSSASPAAAATASISSGFCSSDASWIERRHRLAAALDHAGGRRLAVRGQRDRPPAAVDEPLRVGPPVRDAEAGVAQRAAEGVAELAVGPRLAELDHEPADGGPRELRAQQAGQERVREGREQDEREPRRDIVRPGRERVRGIHEGEGDDRRPAGRDDRRQRPAERARRGPPAAGERDRDGQRNDRAGRADDGVERRGRVRVGGDQHGVVGAVRALARRGRRTAARAAGRPSRRPYAAVAITTVARDGQPARRERQQRMHEEPDPEAADDQPDGERDRAVGIGRGRRAAPRGRPRTAATRTCRDVRASATRPAPTNDQLTNSTSAAVRTRGVVMLRSRAPARRRADSPRGRPRG